MKNVCAESLETSIDTALAFWPRPADLWQPSRRALLRSRRHVEQLLFGPQEVVLERLDEKVFAGVVVLDERLLLDPLDEVVLGQQRQTNVLHQARDQLVARSGRVVLRPRDDGLENLQN